VELTETAAVSDASALLRFYAACRAQGITIALDDCRPGHPYGSAAFIKSFRPQLIKIDGEYVKECFSGGNLAELQDMIETAHAVRAGVIAEYVSNHELRAFVFRLGADYAQGYALGEPSPLASINEGVYTFSFSS
jgi:EAL domain-containing protein (putative c-di-GMP-specific phosphodiesterase class I)